jgi:hypothetical protein
MNCEFRERGSEGRGCKFEILGKCNQSSYYYCIEYMKHKLWNLSFSSVRTFDVCPRKFYYTDILGIKRKESFSSLPLRSGSYLHGLVSHSNKPVYFTKDELRDRYNIDMVYQVMNELNLFCVDSLHNEPIHELTIVNTQIGLKGILDLYHIDYFGELKLSAKPESYLNNWTAYDQLAYYFLITPHKYCYMLPVRTPLLKEGKDEHPDMYRHRLKSDILRRPKFYFPEYGEGRTEFKWGRKYYRSEFDLEGLQTKINWVRNEIRSALNAGYFTQRYANCMSYGYPCDYAPVCETGGINEVVYEYKQIQGQIKQNKEEDSYEEMDSGEAY